MTEPHIDVEPAGENRLLQDCYRYMQADKLVLPTLPDIAFKIRRTINDEHISTANIARIVQMDPAITAKLIQVANSPMYAGRRKIESCPEALTRTGLKAAQNIITTIAMKAVFNAKSALIRKKMADLWTHSSYVAAISAVIAQKTPGFDPDRAMLAGLVHDIGIVPILAYADNIPEALDQPQNLRETVRKLRIPIGLQIIRKWDFPLDFEEVITQAENWHYDSQGAVNYTDIVMIAQLHSFIGQVDSKKIPRLDTLPAYNKLVAGRMDADVSINILDSAKYEIDQIRNLLQ